MASPVTIQAVFKNSLPVELLYSEEYIRGSINAPTMGLKNAFIRSLKDSQEI